MGNLQERFACKPLPDSDCGRVHLSFPFIAIAHRPPNHPPLVALTQPKHFIETGPIVVEMGHRLNYLKDRLFYGQNL